MEEMLEKIPMFLKAILTRPTQREIKYHDFKARLAVVGIKKENIPELAKPFRRYPHVQDSFIRLILATGIPETRMLMWDIIIKGNYHKIDYGVRINHAIRGFLLDLAIAYSKEDLKRIIKLIEVE